MTDQPLSGKKETRATEGMGGKGFYDSYSAIQCDTVLMQAERLRSAVRALDLSGTELRVIDYGCGPGRNSMAAFRTVLEEIHGRGADMPVVTVHNDQIGNDWNDLFANIRGPEGYLRHAGPLRPEASAGSFFDGVASELIPNPYTQLLGDGGDIGVYAKNYAAFARGFSESSFRNGLFDPSAAGADEADQLAETFFARLEALFATEPRRHIFDNYSMTVVLRRR